MQTMIRHPESIGLLLLLTAATWQLFFEDPISRLATETQSYRFERKLDDLWIQTGNIQRQISSSNVPTIIGQRYVQANTRWPFAEQDEDLQRVSRQALLMTRIRAGLFIIGSLLVIFTRANITSKIAKAQEPQ